MWREIFGLAKHHRKKNFQDKKLLVQVQNILKHKKVQKYNGWDEIWSEAVAVSEHQNHRRPLVLTNEKRAGERSTNRRRGCGSDRSTREPNFLRFAPAFLQNRTF